MTRQPRALNGAPRALLLQHLVTDTDDCITGWPYARASRRGERPALIWDGRMQLAQRVLCGLAHGDPPTPRHQAAHSCGNGGCLNARHLRWATQIENEADKLIHGTRLVGESHPNVRLSDEEVSEIRAAYAAGEMQRVLAERYGVTQTHVSNLVLGKRRREVSVSGVPQCRSE